MKRKNLVKILVLFILAGSIANAEYLKENGEIYYEMPYFEVKSKVKEADAKSFKSFEDRNKTVMDSYYGKDNKNVYLLGKKLKNVSPKEFEILNEDYIKDNKNIYKVKLEEALFFSSNEINTKKISVDGLNVKTFRTLENDKEIETNYFGDKNSVYYIYENIDKIKEADRNSFKILDYYIAKDKKNVYYKGKKMENVDSESFKEFGSFIAKDKNRVFYIEGNEDIKDIDAASFEMMGDTYYFSDKKNVFAIKYGGEFPDGQSFVKLKNIDRNSFSTLSREIGKDKNGVYYIGEKIDGISPNNARVIEELGQDNYILQGDNNYYLMYKSQKDSDDEETEKIKTKKINDLNIDFDTFKYFGIFDYYKDKNSFYYHSDNDLKKIKSGIDVKSAENVNNLNNIVKDKNNLYYFYNGEIRKIDLKIDINSLEVLNNVGYYYSDYIRDRNNVYFVDNENGIIKIVKNADNNTFKVVEENYGMDSKNVYYNGRKLDFVGLDGLKIFDENYLKDKNGVYQIYETDNNKVKIKPIKNLNIDVASFENILKGTFYKDKNSVYYVEVDGDKQELKKLEGADADTFEPGIFSKDKNSVYVEKQRLEGVNPKGFEILDNDLNFIKDYKNVFYLDRAEDGITFIPRVQNTEGVDVATLESVGKSAFKDYFKDKNNVYIVANERLISTDSINTKLNFYKLIGANPKTFELIDNFGKDDKNVYFLDKKLKGIDAKTFEEISFNIVKDKNGLHILLNSDDSGIKTRNLKISGLDLKTFKKLENGYYKDKNNIYYNLDNNLYTIKNPDLATFEVLNSPYSSSIYFAKDKNNVYYQNKKIDGLVADSFEQIQSNFIKDRNGIYKFEEDENEKSLKITPINAKIDFKNLKELDWKYFGDDKNIYYFDENDFKKLDNADVNSFKRIEYTSFFKDKNNVYYDGEKVEGIDMNSIEVISGMWIKDKNNVFYEGQKLKGISSDNFNYFDGGLSYETILFDKNGIYKFLKNEDNEKAVEIIRLDGKELDSKTLERISSPLDSSDYFKDKNGVYFMDGKKFVKVNGADKDSFEVTESGKYGKDKNNVYFEGKKLEGKKSKEFEEEN